MRKFLLIVLALGVPSGNALGQQSAPTYAPPSYPHQSYTPQTYAPQGYAPQGFVPKADGSTAQNRPAPPRKLFHCLIDGGEDGDYCAFYTTRILERGAPCRCNGQQGSIY